jgi:hypothetical protein
MLSERKKQWISINKEEICRTIAVSVKDTREKVEAIWREVSNVSVKEKAVAWKVVLENDLLSKVEIADDFRSVTRLHSFCLGLGSSLGWLLVQKQC